jgi:ankyrin repeat protein
MVDSNGESPLFIAARFDDLPLAKFLITSGADVNYSNSDGNTFLHIAAKHNSSSIMRHFVSDMNRGVKNQMGHDYAMLLVISADLADESITHLLSYLLDNSYCSLTSMDYNGNNLLLHACITGNYKLAHRLFCRGANVNIKNDSGSSPLHIIMSHIIEVEDTVAINLFRNMIKSGAANLNLASNDGLSPLMVLAKIPPSCNSGVSIQDLMQELLSCQADVNAKDFNGNTSLKYACDLHQIDRIKLLLSYGAQLNDQDNEGKTCLHAVCYEGYRDIAEILLDAGAILNIRDQIGKTAVTYACECNRVDVVKLLIERGADINIMDAKGSFPLSIAVRNGYEDIVAVLLPHVERKPLLSALTLACQYFQWKVVQILIFSDIFLKCPQEDKVKMIFDLADITIPDDAKVAICDAINAQIDLNFIPATGRLVSIEISDYRINEERMYVSYQLQISFDQLYQNYFSTEYQSRTVMLWLRFSELYSLYSRLKLGGYTVESTTFPRKTWFLDRLDM